MASQNPLAAAESVGTWVSVGEMLIKAGIATVHGIKSLISHANQISKTPATPEQMELLLTAVDVDLNRRIALADAMGQPDAPDVPIDPSPKLPGDGA